MGVQRAEARVEGPPVGVLDKNRGAADAQERLGPATPRVPIVPQAMGAAGKDGRSHVMAGVNLRAARSSASRNRRTRSRSAASCGATRCEQGASASSTAPTARRPRRPGASEILDRQKLPIGLPSYRGGRFDDINQFERHLVRNGTVVLKFFSTCQKKEEKRRFMNAWTIENTGSSRCRPEQRGHWDGDYQEAFEDMIEHTSTRWAPWGRPADNMGTRSSGGIVTEASKGSPAEAADDARPEAAARQGAPAAQNER